MSGTVGDNVARASGVIASAGGGGKILQMVQTEETSKVTYSTTSYGAVTGYEVAITPTKESSKIQVVLTIGEMGCTGGSGFKFARDIDGGGYTYLTPIGDSDGARTQCYFYGAGNQGPKTIVLLDSPSYTLTNVLTYQLHARAGSGDSIYFGSDTTDNNYDYRWRAASNMQLWEISA